MKIRFEQDQSHLQSKLLPRYQFAISSSSNHHSLIFIGRIFSQFIHTTMLANGNWVVYVPNELFFVTIVQIALIFLGIKSLRWGNRGHIRKNGTFIRGFT